MQFGGLHFLPYGENRFYPALVTITDQILRIFSRLTLQL